MSNKEASNFVGMSDTMKHYELEKLVAEFEKEYPINYGRPYPHFEHGMPVATHIVQHFRTALRTAYTVGLESERERIRKGVDSLPYREKGEIIGGLFTDERMRGPNVEQIETINRFAVHKVIDNTIDDYDLVSNKGRDK